MLQKYTGKKIKVSWNKKDLCFRVGKEKDYDDLDIYQYRKVILAGITLGALPIMLYPLGNIMTLYTSPLLFYIYVRGCMTDIEYLRETWRSKE